MNYEKEKEFGVSRFAQDLLFRRLPASAGGCRAVFRRMGRDHAAFLCEAAPGNALRMLQALAGLTDRDAGLTGNLNDPQSILLPEQSHTYGTFVWTQNVYLTRKQKENFRFIPLYEVLDEKYTVYFTIHNS